MAITAYPFDAQDISEAQYGALLGSAIMTGINAGPTANDFKVTANGSNLTLTITAVSGNSSAVVRGHLIAISASETVTLAAAEAGARVDLVVLRLNYASNTVTPVILKGTSGSSTPPSASWGSGGFYDLPLAKVAVGAGVLFVSQSNVTDIRRFSGWTTGAWINADGRPVTGSPALSVGWNAADSRWEYTLNGSTWTPLVEVSLPGSSVTGTLPISKGGTGATSATTALQALGIYVQSTQPAYAAGRVWIKTP